MTKFLIEQSIQKIDDYFYLEFTPAADEYKTTVKHNLYVYNLNIDTKVIRENLFIILTEIFKTEFTNNYYL
jgi:hypothetical protein